ncbi:MAG: hypothetical protein IJA82_02775 [Clostridia bacterium]|nr:hypothetical protein [Clostridia bacterium]
MSVGNQLTIQDYESFVKNSEKTKKAKGNKSLSSLENQHNRVLYDQYVREAELGNQKKVALETNAASKSQSLRDNAVLTEKAKRYLEQKAVLEGNANSGIAQSNLIDLYSQSAQNRANIGASYDQKESDLLLEYDKAINESKTSANQSLLELEQAEAQQKELDRQEYAALLSQKLTEYENKVASGDIVDADQGLQDTYDKYKDYLDAEKDYELIDKYTSVLERGKNRASIATQVGLNLDSTFSIDEISDQTFGQWHSTAANALKEHYKYGTLDKYVEESGGNPIVIDIDGDNRNEYWVVYENGKLHIVNKADGNVPQKANNSKGFNYFKMDKNGNLFNAGTKYAVKQS